MVLIKALLQVAKLADAQRGQFLRLDRGPILDSSLDNLTNKTYGKREVI